MALGDSYIDAAALAAYLGIGDSYDSLLLNSACDTATEAVNQHCQRQFQKVTVATARVYRARDCSTLEVDDFYSTTGLVIATDGGDTGTYSTTWTTADYVLEPFDGVDAGMTGFPDRTVRAVESLTFPTSGYRARVQVTALWGWTAVPDSVTLATKIMAAYLFNLKDSPLGVAYFGDAGLIRVRDVPQATMLLDPYAHPARTGPLVA